MSSFLATLKDMRRYYKMWRFLRFINTVTAKSDAIEYLKVVQGKRTRYIAAHLMYMYATKTNLFQKMFIKLFPKKVTVMNINFREVADISQVMTPRIQEKIVKIDSLYRLADTEGFIDKSFNNGEAICLNTEGETFLSKSSLFEKIFERYNSLTLKILWPIVSSVIGIILGLLTADLLKKLYHLIFG